MKFTIGGNEVEVETYDQLLWHLKRASTPENPPDGKTNAPSAPSAVNDPPPRLFALIIGINKYVSQIPLHGAVADADDMDLYLKETLKVPPDQIRNLRDREATRATMIGAFRELATDPRIQKGDAIVIFYAGHGGQEDAPAGWESEGGKTEFLLPFDIYNRDPVTRKLIPGIPDRTVGALLNKIAEAKGDNITVIFDCCQSGSGTRDGNVDPSRIARVGKMLGDTPPDLDEDIWKPAATAAETRGSTIPAGFAHTGLASHVLLAACSKNELSNEINGRGYFTSALSATLRAVGAEKMAYKGVIPRMRNTPEQSPQCEGVNQDRILFNGKAPSIGRVASEVTFVDGQYVLDAGAARGITSGSEFSVYNDQALTGNPLGTLVAGDSISPFSTVLKPPPNSLLHTFSGVAYAIQSKAGTKEHLRLYVEMKPENVNIFQAVADLLDSTTERVVLVGLDKKPHLTIALGDGDVVFTLHDDLVARYGVPTRMIHTVQDNVDAIRPVIQAAAHFYFNLELKNLEKKFDDPVELQFYELTPTDEISDDITQPTYKLGDNLNVNSVVYIDDSDKMYGFKLINKTPTPLYPSLFYFDNATFEIADFFLPGTTSKIHVLDAPLEPNSSLTIGWGSGGRAPRNFSLPTGRSVDVSYLKLFVTSEPVDYAGIKQPSPFFGASRGDVQDAKTTWDTILLPIVQRKST